jgi:ABC-type Zn2+ transport system substrate-binding protein/surface adhesin
MSVNSKHVATFLLGAAAALAAYKYHEMTPEQREKLIASLKEKAKKLKTESEDVFEKGKDYFEELKKKGSEVFHEHFGDVNDMMHKLFGGKKEEPTANG